MAKQFVAHEEAQQTIKKVSKDTSTLIRQQSASVQTALEVAVRNNRSSRLHELYKSTINQCTSEWCSMVLLEQAMDTYMTEAIANELAEELKK